MPTTQVLAMSVVCQGGEEEASKLPLHKILEQIHPDLERKVVGNKAFLQIGDCEVFENLYNNCIGERERLEQQFPDLSPKFYLALAKGEDYDVAKTIAHELLAAVVFNQAEIPDHVLCYITKEIYDQLPPKYRDNYHSSTAMRADIKAHRRFSEGGLDCFVVSPIGTEETVIRERADFIFEHYIKPACEATNYRARRSDMIVSPTISVEMLKRLEESPMVVVYLGSPKYGGWNPNVMFEFGYRQRSAKPLILLKDRTAKGQPYSLPFDISDYRYVDLPENDKEESKEDYGSTIRAIRDFILKPPEEEWTHFYPNAIYEFAEGRAKVIQETRDLKHLFDLPHVLRKDLQSEILPHLYDCMPREQAAAFRREQSELLGSIMMRYECVRATVPMLFSKHPTLRNRAFLPVIVSYSNIWNVLRLNAIYVEVTGALKKHTDGYFYCDLVGQPIPEQPAEENVISMKA